MVHRAVAITATVDRNIGIRAVRTAPLNRAVGGTVCPGAGRQGAELHIAHRTELTGRIDRGGDVHRRGARHVDVHHASAQQRQTQGPATPYETLHRYSPSGHLRNNKQ